MQLAGHGYFRRLIDASMKAQVTVNLFQLRDRVEDTKEAQERGRLLSGRGSVPGMANPISGDAAVQA